MFAFAFSTFLVLLGLLLTPSLLASPLTEEDVLPPTHVIANHVVISEVQTAGTGTNAATQEFVELYNPTGLSQSLDTCQLRRKTSSGTTNVLLVNDFPGWSIPANSYFLIAHANYSGTNVDLRFTSTSSSYTITDNNTLILECEENSVLQEIDKLGFGTAGDAEAIGFSPNPAANESIERKAFYFSLASDMSGPHANFGNSYDSGNNSNDFVLRTTSNPQNSSSTPERCCTTVTGTLTQQGRADHTGTAVLLWPGSGLRTTTDASGQFSIPNVPAIASAETLTYTLEVSVPGYLTPRTTLDLRNHLVNSYLPASVTFPALTLLSGDLNGDNRINIFDLALVGSHYGNTGVSPADVNGDGQVNIQDLALISGNFGRINEYVWNPYP